MLRIAADAAADGNVIEVLNVGADMLDQRKTPFPVTAVEENDDSVVNDGAEIFAVSGYAWLDQTKEQTIADFGQIIGTACLGVVGGGCL